MSVDMSSLEKRLIGEIWTSTELYANVETLCDFGSRFGGTESERQARDFLRAKFESHGLADVHLEEFEYTGWSRGTCDFRVLSPYKRPLPAISLVYSPSTPPEGLRGQVVDVGMGTEDTFARRREELGGKIVMATSASPDAGHWIHRREKYGRAVEAGASGFIFVNHVPGLLPPTGSLRGGRLGEIPAVGMAREHGFNLQRWCSRGDVTVEMHIANGSGPTKAWHVVGEVPGDPGDEVIVVGGHYDGHDISQGAMDDGAGTCLVLELARLFAPLAGGLRRTVRFIAFAVEELGVLGSTEYVKTHRDEMDRVAMMVNLDSGVGSGPRGFVIGGFKELEPLLSGYGEDMGYPLKIVDRIPTAADNFPFFMAGVPAINLSARGRERYLGRGFGHTPADTLDKVDKRDMKESAMVMAQVLLRLAQDEGPLGRHRTQEEIKDILIAHQLEAPLRAQDKWPFGGFHDRQRTHPS